MDKIGLGTYKLNKNIAYNTITQALILGYRCFDTAELYNNEKQIGKAIIDYVNKTTLNLDDIFITTKIWKKSLFKGYDQMKKSVLKSLNNLPKIDLLLLHTPDNHINAWSNLSRIKSEFSEFITDIGVSNFNISHLQDIYEEYGEYPKYNQIEIHPYCTRSELVKFCYNNNIQIIAHSSLLRGDFELSDIIQNLSLKYNITHYQLFLAWAVNKKFNIIPMTTDIVHMQENLDVLNVNISDTDMNIISNLNKNYYLFPNYKN